jgi:hypothetical protein
LRLRRRTDVDVIVHASLKNRLVELAIHLVGVGIGGGIGHFDDRDSAISAVIDELLGGFAGCRL